MSNLSINDQQDRLFHLNTIELLTAIFRGPDSDGWTAIIEAGLPELLALAPEKLKHLTATLKNLQQSLPDLSDLPEGLSRLETEYVRLFIAASGGIAAPLYESCHLGNAPRIMGDAALAMQSRLNQCGLEVSLDSNEPPDHISIELEYLYHLLSTAWSENDPALESKGREFARLEMLPWVRRFLDALANGDAHPAYSLTAQLTVQTLEAIGG